MKGKSHEKQTAVYIFSPCINNLCVDSDKRNKRQKSKSRRKRKLCSKHKERHGIHKNGANI